MAETQEQGPWTKYQPPPPSADEEEGPWKKFAQPAAPSNVPVRAPGQAKQLTTEEVNKFQPPTQFEKEIPGHGISTEGMGSAAWDIAKRFGAGILDSVNPTTSTLLHPSHMPIVQAAHEAKAGWQRGGAPGTRFDTLSRLGEAATSGIGSLVGMSGESAAAHAARGEGGAILGEAAVPAAVAIAGPLAEQIPKIGPKVAAMRQPGRMGNFDSVVRDLAGKTPADLDFTKTLDKVRPDVAEIARKSGFAEKGNARVGEFQQMLEGRAGEIWDEEHKPQVARHKDMPIDHEAVAQRATAALSDADRANNPAAARAADRWIASALNPDVIGTVGGADEMIRRINAEVPNLPEPFKVIGKTVRNAAVKALRGELEGALEATGEEGVKGPNTRWGGLREVSNAIEGRLNNAVNKPLSWWDTLRSARTPMVEGAIGGGSIGSLGGKEGAAIGAGVGAATGAAGSVVHDLLSEPGGRIARAMKGLGKTNLQPDTVQTPRWVGNKPAALIPEWAGGATPMGNGPDTSGPVPEGERHPPTVWSAEDINRIARETPKPPPNVPGAPTAIGTVQPIAMGPGQPGPLYHGPMLPATVQRFPALPESVSGGETVPSTTVKPWQPLLGTPPEKVAENVKRGTPEGSTEESKGVAEKKEVPTKSTKAPVEKETGKPPEGTTERRTSVRDITGPDFFRTARMNELRKAAEAGDELAKTQLEDMKANPFERHEGKNINEVKAMNKPTMTRESAEAATEERKGGRQARFGEEGVLPGMGEHVAKQAEGAAKVKGDELTAEMNKPRDVNEAAGRMESLSPLFRGTGASPQNEMFRPSGEAVKPMEKPAVEVPKEEEPKETEVKGVTAKESKPAKARTAKPAPIEKRFGRDEILDAEGMLNTESGMMGTADRPGVYFDENPENEFTPQRQQSSSKGVTSGGKWRGVRSGREMQPFMAEHPEWGPEYIQKALRNKDSAAYQKVMDAAIEFIRDSKRTPEERTAAAEERFANFKPAKSEFVKMKKPAAD